MEPNSSASNFISVFSNLPNPFENSKSADGNYKPISLWPGIYHSPVTIALWETRSKVIEIMMDPSNDAPPQTQLLTRTPSQSRMTVLYNFSSDLILREQYRDPWYEMRIGKLLEDLDALAGTISVKHCIDEDCTTRPLLLVTASVDKIVLKKPISVDRDLRISGSVIWVGWSSIEIQLEVSQANEGRCWRLSAFAIMCPLHKVDNPEHPLINVEVVAHVTRPEIRSSEVSNTFYFTFTICSEAKAGKNGFTIRNVVPATEEEARRILERKDAKALQLAKCANK